MDLNTNWKQTTALTVYMADLKALTGSFGVVASQCKSKLKEPFLQVSNSATRAITLNLASLGS